MVQARNREAGRVGQVFLRYDRSCGRYYDVDHQVNGMDACPIRPLAPRAAAADDDLDAVAEAGEEEAAADVDLPAVMASLQAGLPDEVPAAGEDKPAEPAPYAIFSKRVSNHLDSGGMMEV